MALGKKAGEKPAKAAGGKGPKKVGGKGLNKQIGGKMPVKRSINLVLVDENKINPFKAILGILLVLALAAAFGKYMVYDRLAEMSRASGEVTRMRQTLDDTLKAIEGFGEVEAEYAHYTYDGMSQAELSLVDRARIGELVRTIILEQDNLFDINAYQQRLEPLVDALGQSRNPRKGLQAFRTDAYALGMEIMAQREQVYSWSVTDNVLTVDLTGKSLRRLNQLAREVEKNPIVDSCTLITANKDASSKRDTAVSTGVRGKFIIYLILPPEEPAATEEVSGS